MLFSPPFSTRNTLFPPLPVFEAAQTTCSAKVAAVGPQTTRGEEHEDTKLAINFLSLVLFSPHWIPFQLVTVFSGLNAASISWTKIDLKRLWDYWCPIFRSLHNSSITNLRFVLPSSLSKERSPHLSQGLSYPSCTAIYIYDTTLQGFWEHTMQSQAVLPLGNIRKKIRHNILGQERIHHPITHGHCYSTLFTFLRNTQMPGWSVNNLPKPPNVGSTLMAYGLRAGQLNAACLPRCLVQSETWKNSASSRNGIQLIGFHIKIDF